MKAKVACRHCGKSFSKGPGIANHEKWCDLNPQSLRHKQAQLNQEQKQPKVELEDEPAVEPEVEPEVKPEAEPQTFDEWTRENPHSAHAEQKATEALKKGFSSGTSASGLMACLAEDGVGPPALIALACARALPPKLTDEELHGLRAVYAGGRPLPGWAQTILVTAVIVGPRIASHPTYGPQLRAFFVGKPKRAPANVHPIRPEPKPSNQPEPKPEPEAPDEEAARAWESI